MRAARESHRGNWRAGRVEAKVRSATYNRDMARGWESKSVEEQLDLARQQREHAAERPVSPDDAVKKQERERLRLARARVAEQLARSRNERYTEMLRQELASLEAAEAALNKG